MAHQTGARPPVRALIARLPEDLGKRLEEAAAKSGRSLNAELIHRLEQTFAKQKEAGLEQRIAAATQEAVNLATQQSTATLMETLGPIRDALLGQKTARSK